MVSIATNTDPSSTHVKVFIRPVLHFDIALNLELVARVGCRVGSDIDIIRRYFDVF